MFVEVGLQVSAFLLAFSPWHPLSFFRVTPAPSLKNLSNWKLDVDHSNWRLEIRLCSDPGHILG